MNLEIVFIGGGNMGEAMIAAVLNKKLALPSDMYVVDTSKQRREYLEKQYEVAATGDAGEAVKAKNIVILAVKPQNMTEVLSDLKPHLKNEQLVVSIAAGIKIDTLSQGLEHFRIIRVMPNTPAQVGFGMSGWTATPEVTGEQKEWVRTILRAMGKEIYFDDEKYLDMVTAVSGSGPAYFFLMAEAMVEAGMTIGLPRSEAEKLVSQTMLGAAHLLEQSGKSPSVLKQDVTSRGGTTERALSVLDSGEFTRLIQQAIEAAYMRALEMGA